MDNKKKYIWIISDTHFNHNKIIEYENRPINYNEEIIKNWNKLVNPQDTIIHLWDVIFDRQSEIENILNKLNWNKILVKGNHDKNNFQWYINKGFILVCEEIKIKYKNVNLIFSHKPKIELEENEYCICGHLHSKINLLKDYHKNNRLISLELNKYKPIRLDLLNIV
jgi:calcineurin-like phosphoesterase family protein